MSRWAHDPDGAAGELIRRSLHAIDAKGSILLADAPGGLAGVLAEQGAVCTAWSRRLDAGKPAVPWPPPGPFDCALLRIPKAKDEQEMAAHAALSALREGGRLIAYGGNDEGIRSAAAMLERLCGGLETLAARGHGRVVAVPRPADATVLRTPLSAWRKVSRLQIAGAGRDWVSYPGVFAAGRIDEGTALLLGALPRLTEGASVLDYGCGSGVIAAAALAAEPSLALTLLDNDTVALAAARENVPGARVIAAARIADAGQERYDAILSNPPLHRGVAEDHGLLEQLVADAPGHLQPGGVLQIVVQRRVPLDRLLGKHFAEAETVAESGRYRVWRARAGGGRGSKPRG